MSRKGIILALIIFVALGLYVFLVEKKKPLPEGKESILKFDKDMAGSLVIKQGDKEIVLARDKDGKWQITSPLLTKADDDVINEMVSDVSGLDASQALEVNPSEWENFGLKEPACEVTVSIDGREEKLSFGDKNPAGTSIYARLRGKDKVYLVSAYLVNSFKKEIFDLRDKVILSFDRDKVEKIELLYPEKEGIVCKKQKEKDKGDKWFLDGKEKIELDNIKVNDILWDLSNLKAKGFAAEEIQDPSSCGLDKPDVKAIITAEDKEKTILLGKKSEEKEDAVYAQVIGDRRLFLVASDLLSRLKKDLSDLKKEEEKKEEETEPEE